MSDFNILLDFIDRAVKSRKYSASTASGLKAALKLFKPELNKEELESPSLFKENIDSIYRNVSLKYGKELSAASLNTYKSRVSKVLTEFESYGSDPTKMSNWIPKTRLTQKKNAQKHSDVNNVENEISSNTQDSHAIPHIPSNSHKIELSLRPDAKISIILPRDLSVSEFETIKTILESLTPKK